MTEWVYWPVIQAALGVFRVFDFRFTVTGDEHIPDVGGAVLAANHVSYFDFMFVGLAAHPKRRYVRFMAKRAVFDNPVAGPLMRGMHHIPVDRSAGAAAYRHAVDALRRGELVGVFPESTISRSFVPRSFKSGAARMALEAGVPLLPVVTWGGQQVWTSGHGLRWRRHVPVAIHVGAPIAVTGAATPESLTLALRDAVIELAEQVQRAAPVPTVPGDDWWQPAHLGGSAPTPAVAAEVELAAIAGKARRRAG